MKFTALISLLLVLALLTATAQEAALPADRHGVPRWDFDPRFAGSSFTFLRLLANDHRSRLVDFPDSDLNFSYRLHQMTALNVNPVPRTLAITSPELRDYPFSYIVEGGHLNLNEQEGKILRDYLLDGGFLMFDDFWGGEEWNNVAEQIRKIFPDRPPVALTLDHPVFHTVFDLKEFAQIPSFEFAQRGRTTGIFWERPDARGAKYYGVFDDRQRMMILICRDTDLGDGWEREAEDPWFFKTFSEAKAYPLGVNIIVYVMTH